MIRTSYSKSHTIVRNGKKKNKTALRPEIHFQIVNFHLHKKTLMR